MKKLIIKYRLFIILLIINIILCFYSPKLAKISFSLTAKNLLEMLSIIPPIFILLGLLDVWIPKETMMKYMGKDAGFKGALFAFTLGSFSAGPLYAAFPIASIFLKKRVSFTNVFIFLFAWSTTKIPMMLFEVSQLGYRFALTRFIFNVGGISIIAYIIEKTTSATEIEKIYQINDHITEK